MMFSQSTQLSDRVYEALKNDPRTKEVTLDIAFNQGVITLSGAVTSETISMAVEEIAKSQPGVITVINDIRVEK